MMEQMWQWTVSAHLTAVLGSRYEQWPLLSCSEHDISPGTARRLGCLPVVSQRGEGEKRASAVPLFSKESSEGLWRFSCAWSAPRFILSA